MDGPEIGPSVGASFAGIKFALSFRVFLRIFGSSSSEMSVTMVGMDGAFGAGFDGLKRLASVGCDCEDGEGSFRSVLKDLGAGTGRPEASVYEHDLDA